MKSTADEIAEGMAVKLASSYVVKPGDTISWLAAQSGSTVQEILAANPGVVPTKLHPGQTLVVPAKNQHHKPGQPQPPHPTPTQPHQSQHFDMEAEVGRAAGKYGLNPEVLKALIFVESSNNPHADSGQAKGLTQLTPAAAKHVGVTDPFDPVQSIHGGAMWLASAMQEAGRLRGAGHHNQLAHALMIYHAGMPAVQEWVLAGSPAGGFGQVGSLTLNYAKKILEMSGVV